MQVKLYRLALACLFSIWGSLAHSKLQLGVEPYLGYSQLTFRSTAIGSGGNTVSDSMRAAVLGGKGGVLITPSSWAALDYHLGGPYFLENNKNEFLNRMWGIGVGFTSQSKQRLWIGYYFDNSLDDIEHNYVAKGTAYKLSLGFEFQTKLSLNVEYCLQQYTSVQGSSQSLPTLDVSVVFVSVSSPIMLR